jgi:(1->4)-alpha-D-glucan 1-alpha-D-glucosylmutase
MAKGVEDTAFYRYGRLLALNDVGGDPSRFGIDVQRFHVGCTERQERFPLNLLTTMTHDAKRSADVRARIAVLSWMPDQWGAFVDQWLALTETLRDGDAPDDIERYFLLQTLVGAWPISAERLERYMQKALREAKRNTSWVAPSAEYEAAVARFCQGLYTERALLDVLEQFVEGVALAGDRVALGQVVLKLTSPGIPDIYQGDELSLRALVDPDNRRPVDWDRRRALLASGADCPKLRLTTRLLRLRARRPEPFAGAYESIDAGPDCCAFLRGGQVLVVVATRSGPPTGALPAPRGRWRDVMTDEELSFSGRTALGRLLSGRAAAVFERLGR